MAFFKFRLPQASAADAAGPFSNPPTESIEVLRRRARHRLIGATVLVLVGVVGFPLVFDTQPRPVSADLHIEIPDRDKARPTASPPPSAPLQHAATLDPKEELVTKADAPVTTPAPAPPASAPAPAPAAPTSVQAPPPVVSAAAAPSAATPPAAPAATAASVSPKPAEKEETKEGAARYVVQVGAFSDEAKVKELRSKVEKAGLKTYTQEANTKEGKRIRVRVGPFQNREDADKAADKLKQLSLQPQVLTL